MLVELSGQRFTFRSSARPAAGIRLRLSLPPDGIRVRRYTSIGPEVAKQSRDVIDATRRTCLPRRLSRYHREIQESNAVTLPNLHRRIGDEDMQLVPFERLQNLLTVESLLEPVREAFRAYSTGEANVPPVQHLEMPYCHGAALHIKSGHMPPHSFCLVKVASTFPENPNHTPPTPSLDGLIALFSTIDGRPLAIIEDHAYITHMRTATAGAIAAQLLARPQPRRLGVIGTGAQAKLQAAAICAVFDCIDELWVWGRTQTRVEAYVRDLTTTLPKVAIKAAPNAEAVAGGVDILVTATYSTEPLVRASWLPRGILVIGMGADSVTKQELDADCIRLADFVVVDSRSQNEILGEVGRGIRAGDWTAGRMDAEIGGLLSDPRGVANSGVVSGRTPDSRVVCKLTGIATQEIFVCKHLMDTLGLS
jgi:ornithine cyclodeaminase/alanine dehydrogenase-like protein (mu-crystallin family)